MPISTANSGTANNVKNSEDVLFSPGSSLESVRIRVTDQPLHISGSMPPNHFIRVEREYDGNADPKCIDIPALPVMCKDGCNPLMLFNVPNPDCPEGRFIQSDIWLFYQGTYKLYYEVGEGEPAIDCVPDDVFVWYKADKLVSKMGINLPLCGENQCPPSCMPEHVIELTCEDGPCEPTDGPDCLKCETPVAYWRNPDNPQDVCLMFWVAPQGVNCEEGVEQGRWETVCLNQCPPLDEDIVLGDGKELVYCGPDGTTVRGPLTCPDPGPGVELGDQSAVFLRCNPDYDPNEPPGPDNPTIISDPILCPPSVDPVALGDPSVELLMCNPDFDPNNPGDPANPPIVKAPQNCPPTDEEIVPGDGKEILYCNPDPEGPPIVKGPIDCCPNLIFNQSAAQGGGCVAIDAIPAGGDPFVIQSRDMAIISSTGAVIIPPLPASYFAQVNVTNPFGDDALLTIYWEAHGMVSGVDDVGFLNETISMIASPVFNIDFLNINSGFISPSIGGIYNDADVSFANISLPNVQSASFDNDLLVRRASSANLIVHKTLAPGESYISYLQYWYLAQPLPGFNGVVAMHVPMYARYSLIRGLVS